MQKVFSVSLRDLFVSLIILAVAATTCYVITEKAGQRDQVHLVFVLAVLIISRMTSGYTCGILSSVVAVFCVNYIFTYPYFAFDFTLSGYPLTFLTMFAVSVIVSTLTSRVKLQESINLISEKEKLRANLLRAVSHDIRTPLTSIGGAASVLLENSDNIDEQEKYNLLKSIEDESSRLIRTVENILSVTKINGHAAIIKNDEIAEEVVSEAVSRFRKYYPDVTIKVEMPDTPLFVPMDGVLIEQVLINLMDNAVIHGKTTSVITIGIQPLIKEVSFSVSDDGCGINREMLVNINGDFENFTSTSHSDSRRSMGIGLSVCASIVKAHGGNITFENLTSGGARFRFTLPLD